MEQFGAVLAGVLADFEAAQGEASLPEDAVERLSLDAHQMVVAQNGGQLARPGLHAYADAVAPPPLSIRPQLDVKF